MSFNAVALIPLHFENSDVRMVLRDGEPWWMLNDVCAILDIANPRVAAGRLREWQKGVHIMDTLGGRQEVAVINEAGVYKLALNSRKPSAEEFERWLTCEVLPSIRRHGTYPPPPPQPALLPDTENWTDGTKKTLAARFREERLRWEAETGHTLANKYFGMSPPVIAAIEDGRTRALTPKRTEYLVLAGIDALYVINGHRTLTPGERALRNAYRKLSPARRAQLAATATASLAALPDGIPDDENPEWTDGDFARARPLTDFPELATAMKSLVKKPA
jgi:prophage antirepressor-like protein